MVGSLAVDLDDRAVVHQPDHRRDGHGSGVEEILPLVGRSRFAADSNPSIANSSILTHEGRAEEPEQEEKLRLSPALNPGC
jgi:hypothetical protein